MASRAEQKAAARKAREIQHAEMKAAATRRTRFMWLGGIVGVAAVALVVAIVASSSGGSGPVHHTPTQMQAAAATVNQELAGIPQSGNVLGNPKAPVTITEYGDLVCPTCDDFALTSAPQIIQSLVKTGKAKLVFRGFETASGTANASQYVNTQVAWRSAGLQNKGWNYILLTYGVQPQTINGTPAEEVSYITPAYLQNIAANVKGLNLANWQGHMTDQKLINQVKADGNAALASGATGTPTVFITGPKGTVKDPEVVPSLATVSQLVNQQS
jgi:protein-disulfide isomerase